MPQSNNEKPKVAFFDVCGTLVDMNTIACFTENYFLSQENNPLFNKNKKKIRTIFDSLRRLHLLGDNASRKHTHAIFKGSSYNELAHLSELFNVQLKESIKKNILYILEDLKKNGYKIFLVSAGIDVYLRDFARFLDVELLCTVLEKDKNGIYTGRIVGDDCIGEGKVAKIKKEVSFFDQIDWAKSKAFGDSFSDIPMMSLVGEAYAVDPDKKLLEFSQKNKWNIIATKK